MLLLELFNSKVDYKVIAETTRKFSTEAVINGRKIVFFATIDSDAGSADVEFWEEATDADEKIVLGKPRRTYALTGSGGEMKVLSMVGASMKEMVERYHPTEIYFTADKDKDQKSTTRANVYERLMKQILPKFDVVRIDKGSSIEFRLLKLGRIYSGH